MTAPPPARAELAEIKEATSRPAVMMLHTRAAIFARLRFGVSAGSLIVVSMVVTAITN